jgi:tryptophanase
VSNDSYQWKTEFEPFRNKVVEPIRLTSRAERVQVLEAAGYNVFGIPSEQVTIDLLTDSGTPALSADQMAAQAHGDEAYAGATSFSRFRRAIEKLTGYPHIFPAHQGRAAERIFFAVTGGPGKVVPANSLFDTTRANVEVTGAEGLDLPCPEAADLRSDYPFKGNTDLDRLEKLFRERAKDVPAFILTVTNNTLAGQPVSLENFHATRELCREYGVPLYLDAARFAENSYFVRQREPGQADRTIEEISREFFENCDGAMMSAKKDGLAHIGGFLATRDDDIARRAQELLILGEGFYTYGGLAGHNLEVIATGLTEVVGVDYLRHRTGQVAALAGELREAGVPVMWPPGGHAVYLEASEFLPHLRPQQLPGVALACAIYLVSGIRCCELGTLAFGKEGPEEGQLVPVGREFVRLAIPRRVYSRAHMTWVAEVLAKLLSVSSSIQGMRITSAPPTLRHFSARLAPEDKSRPLIGDLA